MFFRFCSIKTHCTGSLLRQDMSIYSYYDAHDHFQLPVCALDRHLVSLCSERTGSIANDCTFQPLVVAQMPAQRCISSQCRIVGVEDLRRLRHTKAGHWTRAKLSSRWA